MRRSRGVIGFVAKPRKADRYTTANRFAFLPERVRTAIQDFAVIERESMTSHGRREDTFRPERSVW